MFLIYKLRIDYFNATFKKNITPRIVLACSSIMLFHLSACLSAWVEIYTLPPKCLEASKPVGGGLKY